MIIPMKRYFLWIGILFILYSTAQVACQSNDEDEEDGSLGVRFHDSGTERHCEYRQQQGVCKRRSQCRKPTRYTCRIGLNPIVCCLDGQETTTTRRTVRTTKESRILPTTGQPPKPVNVNSIDLTYPGCGLRAPKATTGGSNAGSRATSSRRMPGLGRRGKRAVVQENVRQRYLSRVKRWGRNVPVIVGGTEAGSNAWPWMVALYKKPFEGATKRFLCGASLISRRYVLSAAHCFDAEKGNIDPSKFSIVVGSHTTKDGTEYALESILVHPDYRIRQYYNDISILKVAKPVVLGRTVNPVCLPSEGLRSKIRPNVNEVTVTGWGDTTFGGVSSQVLRQVTIPIVPLKECNESYSKVAKANFPRGINNLFICAGEKEGGKDACQGDSGGPMVTQLKDDAWVQLGVVSFGYGCAQAGYPGVYTRTSQYIKFLYDNTDLGKS